MTEAIDNLEAAMSRIESAVESWEDGLPESVFLFVSRLTPLVNVDLLIQDSARGTLLTWRNDDFYGPGWHVPGGVIRHKETAANRIGEVARRELGVSVEFDPQPIRVHEMILPDWRDRGHFVSLLYRCRLTSEPDPLRRYITDSPLPDQWFWHKSCPVDLIPEHRAYSAYMG
jgi:colanic acid biosynthesis protein WcaH